MPRGYIRNDLPEARIRSDVITSRTLPNAVAVLTPGTDTTVLAGTPIGLLLTLTYATQFIVSTPAVFKGVTPIAHIRNID